MFENQHAVAHRGLAAPLVLPTGEIAAIEQPSPSRDAGAVVATSCQLVAKQHRRHDWKWQNQEPPTSCFDLVSHFVLSDLFRISSFGFRAGAGLASAPNSGIF